MSLAAVRQKLLYSPPMGQEERVGAKVQPRRPGVLILSAVS